MDAAFESALSFLANTLQPTASAPAVVALGDGGIQLVWHEQGLDVEATFSSEGSDVYIRDLAQGSEVEIDPRWPERARRSRRSSSA